MGALKRNDAERAAKKISEDIKSRKGVGDEWEAIDEKLKESIIESWTDTIWTQITRGV